MKKRVGIFLFYDAAGIVDRYVDYYLKELKSVTDYLVVVVNGILTTEGRRTLANIADDLFVRENKGFDVWAYHDALLYIGWDELQKFDELVMANYTLFGPFISMKKIFAQMEDNPCDFWGVHRRYEDKDLKTAFGRPLPYGYMPEYVASNFQVFRSQVLHSYEFRYYWEHPPVIHDYLDSWLLHEGVMVKKLCDAGFQFDTLDGESQRNCYPSQTISGAYQQVSKLNVPFVRKKAFYDPGSSVFDYGPHVPRQLIDFIDKHTNYNVDLIWENLLRTTNQYDLKNWMHWNQIVSTEHLSSSETITLRIAVVIYITGKKNFGEILKYLKNFPKDTEIQITTDTKDKLIDIQTYVSSDPDFVGYKISFVLVQEQSQDVAALLIGARDLVLSDKCDLICCMTDDIVTPKKNLCTAEIAMKMYLDNVAQSKNYIENIILLFQANKRIGIAVPPVATHAYFYKNVGNTWEAQNNITLSKALLKELCLNVPIEPNKPPLAPDNLNFWFRCSALKPLFEKKWCYEDLQGFADNSPEGNIITTVRKIYPLVAQGCGYHPMTIITPDYASIELCHMTYETQQYLKVTTSLKPETSKASSFLEQRNRFQQAVKKGTAATQIGILQNRQQSTNIVAKKRKIGKTLVRGCLPIGIWNMLRRYKCKQLGWGYVDDSKNVSGIKKFIKLCCPRFIWNGLRRMKCFLIGGIYREEDV